MRIAINAYEANVVSKVGSNQYAYQILCELEKLTKKNRDDVLVYLPSYPLPDMPKERKGWSYQIVGPKHLWSITGLPRALWLEKVKHNNIDVVLSLGHYAPFYTPFPSVVCVMDLAFLKFPEYFTKRDLIQLRTWSDWSIRHAAKLIAISESTKKDLITEYSLKKDLIRVAYPGYSKQKVTKAASFEKLKKKMKLSSSYLVYVGTIQPRKNLERLLKAFEKIAQHKENKDLQLVMAGKNGWMNEGFEKELKNSKVKDRIILTGFIDESEKYLLIKNAKALVLVGLFEGFGIPALEALSCGTLPVVSNTSSLPEVIGKAGILVDPYDEVSIARGLKKALAITPEQHKLFRKHATMQIQNFSWKNSAQEVYNVLKTFSKEEKKIERTYAAVAVQR